MNKIFKIIFFISFFIISNISFSLSSIKNNIIAKVGDEIITLVELENKINTTLILTNQEINQKNIDKLKTLSLKRLIDLKIKQNEIKRYDISLNDLAIKDHMQKISDNLNIKPDNLKNFFESSAISFEQYKREIEIEFLWQKLIAQIYSSKLNISEDQIEKEIKEISIKKEKIIEFKLAELEVNYENETRDELLDEIKNSIRDIGFSKTVIKYSISTSALNEGEIGWVNSKAISTNLIKKIERLKIGEVSEEIIGTDTLIFYKMLDKRNIASKEDANINDIRINIINKKKAELLNLYSNSHLSKKKNNTLIRF